MPNAQGQPLPGEPGYVAPAPEATGLINTPVAAQATAATPAVTPFEVKPNQTVASNVESIIAKDSPLLQQAYARSQARMNDRGLINSSQAISAGQSALYDAALPIATADAATYDRAATNTAQALNTGALQTAQLKTGVSQSNTAAQNTAILQKNENDVRVQLQNLQSNTQLTAVDKQVEAQKIISAADNQARDAIAHLQADTTLTATTRQIAANEILSLRDTATKTAMQEFQLQADLQKITADGTIRQALADTEAGYKILMQSTLGAADLYKQSIANFAAIIANPNIADKTAALNLGVKQLNDALALIGDVANLDLGSYLEFGPVAP